MLDLGITTVCALVAQKSVKNLVKEEEITTQSKWAKVVIWLLWAMVGADVLNVLIHAVK